MGLSRYFRHLFSGGWSVNRTFPAHAMQAITREIRAAQATHQGEIVFAVQACLDLWQIGRGKSARERAIEVFSELRVWDTEHNNGVLIYLLLADRDVEIVADRGVHARVGRDGWERVCRTMEEAFRRGDFERGVVEGIRAVSAHLQRHYPGRGLQPNELPDRPALL